MSRAQNGKILVSAIIVNLAINVWPHLGKLFLFISLTLAQ